MKIKMCRNLTFEESEQKIVLKVLERAKTFLAYLEIFVFFTQYPKNCGSKEERIQIFNAQRNTLINLHQTVNDGGNQSTKLNLAQA